MRKLHCIYRIVKDGRIVGYDVVDGTGKVHTYSASDLKSGIISNKISIDNLKITSDNRIIKLPGDKEIFDRQAGKGDQLSVAGQSVSHTSDKEIADTKMWEWLRPIRFLGVPVINLIRLKHDSPNNNEYKYLINIAWRLDLSKLKSRYRGEKSFRYNDDIVHAALEYKLKIHRNNKELSGISLEIRVTDSENRLEFSDRRGLLRLSIDDALTQNTQSIANLTVRLLNRAL